MRVSNWFVPWLCHIDGFIRYMNFCEQDFCLQMYYINLLLIYGCLLLQVKGSLFRAELVGGIWFFPVVVHWM